MGGCFGKSKTDPEVKKPTPKPNPEVSDNGLYNINGDVKTESNKQNRHDPHADDTVPGQENGSLERSEAANSATCDALSINGLADKYTRTAMIQALKSVIDQRNVSQADDTSSIDSLAAECVSKAFVDIAMSREKQSRASEDENTDAQSVGNTSYQQRSITPVA